MQSYITELQQALLKDDCFIPGFRNEDPLDLARAAAVTASSEKESASNVINGIARNREGRVNCWRSDSIRPEGETLCLCWNEPKTLRELRLTFDSNLNHGIAQTMSTARQAEQGKGVPPELVKDYDLTLFLNGKEVLRREIRGNYQRLNAETFAPCVCDRAEIRVLNTNGCPDTIIFEVRAYE